MANQKSYEIASFYRFVPKICYNFILPFDIRLNLWIKSRSY